MQVLPDVPISCPRGSIFYPASFSLSMTTWLGLSSGRPSPNLVGHLANPLALEEADTRLGSPRQCRMDRGWQSHYSGPTRSAKLGWLSFAAGLYSLGWLQTVRRLSVGCVSWLILDCS